MIILTYLSIKPTDILNPIQISFLSKKQTHPIPLEQTIEDCLKIHIHWPLPIAITYFPLMSFSIKSWLAPGFLHPLQTHHPNSSFSCAKTDFLLIFAKWDIGIWIERKSQEFDLSQYPIQKLNLQHILLQLCRKYRYVRIYLLIVSFQDFASPFL